MLEDAYNEETKTYNFTPMFGNIKGFIQRSDITLGTMETNFVNGNYSGYGKRNSPKEFAQAVKESGINLVSISHNHSLDYGKEGIEGTKELLTKTGFDVVGDSINEEGRIKIKTVKNVKIAFLAYTYGVEDQDNKSSEDLGYINIFNKEQVKKDLEQAKEQSDFIFVIMHWGEENSNTVNDEQKEMANYLIENGANVILGNHAATVQPMEIKKNKDGENVFVAYSLGNYISSIDNEKSKVELVLNIELRKKGDTGEVVLSKVDYTPIYVLDNGENAENRYQLIDMKGTAKQYASGDTDIISKEQYDKLLDGLDLLERLIK